MQYRQIYYAKFVDIAVFGEKQKSRAKKHQNDLMVLASQVIKLCRPAVGPEALQSGTRPGFRCMPLGKRKAGLRCPSFQACSERSRSRIGPVPTCRQGVRTACSERLRLPAGKTESQTGEASTATLESLLCPWQYLLSDSILGHEKSGSQICRDTHLYEAG